MSKTILPKASQAATKINSEQPQMSEIGTTEDPPDRFGEEMTREARVWRTYVVEADTWDKEMIEGRNNSLDVILIFAALFSAVSTAFIVESLGDLKPDPLDPTAQSLLVISRTLATIASNHSIFLPNQGKSAGNVVFSPPPSAIWVNVLWLLSLSLSIAVSLTAMLAKDWCYIFMSGRSGQIYEQARRRQDKWNGMERWRMTKLLEYLPGLMHLALLLFASGMCVYLWNINRYVAIPVIIITGTALNTYALVTVLPVIDRFCPYSTPATAMARDAVKVLKLIRKAAYQKFHTLSGKAAYPRWLKRVLRHMSGWFESHDASHDSGRLVIEDNRVPMDIITSQMLAWLINHCEDSRSVNVALQAIAGSNNSLPHAPLAECKALDLAVSRLQCRTKLDPAFNTLSPKELSLFHAVSRYASACVILMSGDSYKTDVDRWSCYSEKAGRALDSRYAAAVYSTYTNLLNVASSQSSTSEIFEIAASAAMPLCHWTQGVPQENTALDNALDIVTSVLDRHFQEGGTVLSTSMLHTLAESSVHHLVGRWPREQLHESHELLPVLLSCVVASCFNTAPDTARAAIVSLVAGAFASHTHLGGEIPSNSQDNREKRAVGVLKYYQTNEPDKDQVWALFTFGFFSWLPWFISNDHSAQLATVASHLDRITLSDGAGDQRILDKTIKSMPERFSLAEHAIKPVSDYLLATADNTHGAEMPIMTCALLFFRDPHFNGSHLGVYLIALIALCHTESREHQELCIQAIARQDIRHSPVHNLTSIGGTNLLRLLYRNLLETNKTIAPFIVTHFGLLISCVISDQTNPLSECQSALRPLLNIRDDSSDRNDLDRSLRLRDMVSHLEETINGMTSIATSLERIVQSIAKFCDAGLSQAPGSGVESMVAARNLKQRQMSLKQNCQFYLEKLVGVGVDGPGGSSQPIGTENIRGDAAGSPGTIEGAEKTTKQDK